MERISQEKLDIKIKSHEKWLNTDGKEGSKLDLSNVDLSERNLSKKNLSYANLKEVDLFAADLREAILAILIWKMLFY